MSRYLVSATHIDALLTGGLLLPRPPNRYTGAPPARTRAGLPR